jgi:toxin YoeB
VNLVLSPKARADLAHWIKVKPRLALKIIDLMEEATRTPFGGTGKPEPLKADQSGTWSRRIDEEHRLIYRVSGRGETQTLEILSCRFHYSDR